MSEPLREALERLLREDAESKELDPFFGVSDEAAEQARSALSASPATGGALDGGTTMTETPGLREALRQAIHDTLYHNMDPKAGFRWYWQAEDGTPNDLADAVMARLAHPTSSPEPHPCADCGKDHSDWVHGVGGHQWHPTSSPEDKE